MSKPTVKVAKPNNSKLETIASHAIKMAKARTASFTQKVGVIVAMLYIRGDNGRVSGRASGNVYMRNGRVRQFVVPRLVQNTYTAAARTVFALFSGAWASLTQSQQDTWNNVDNVFKTDRFGNPVLIRGKQLFIERNVNLNNAGSSPVFSYPAPEIVTSITSATLTGTTTAGVLTTLSMAFAPSPTDSLTVHLISSTPVLGSGINRPKASSYRLISSIPVTSATPFNALSAFTAKYGNVAVPGQKIFFRITPINTNTGQAGVPLIIEALTT